MDRGDRLRRQDRDHGPAQPRSPLQWFADQVRAFGGAGEAPRSPIADVGTRMVRAHPIGLSDLGSVELLNTPQVAAHGGKLSGVYCLTKLSERDLRPDDYTWFGPENTTPNFATRDWANHMEIYRASPSIVIGTDVYGRFCVEILGLRSGREGGRPLEENICIVSDSAKINDKQISFIRNFLAHGPEELAQGFTPLSRAIKPRPGSPKSAMVDAAMLRPAWSELLEERQIRNEVTQHLLHPQGLCFLDRGRRVALPVDRDILRIAKDGGWDVQVWNPEGTVIFTCPRDVYLAAIKETKQFFPNDGATARPIQETPAFKRHTPKQVKPEKPKKQNGYQELSQGVTVTIPFQNPIRIKIGTVGLAVVKTDELTRYFGDSAPEVNPLIPYTLINRDHPREYKALRTGERIVFGNGREEARRFRSLPPSIPERAVEITASRSNPGHILVTALCPGVSVKY